jgi:hypothetical protein
MYAVRTVQQLPGDAFGTFLKTVTFRVDYDGLMDLQLLLSSDELQHVPDDDLYWTKHVEI